MKKITKAEYEHQEMLRFYAMSMDRSVGWLKFNFEYISTKITKEFWAKWQLEKETLDYDSLKKYVEKGF